MQNNYESRVTGNCVPFNQEEVGYKLFYSSVAFISWKTRQPQLNFKKA